MQQMAVPTPPALLCPAIPCSPYSNTLSRYDSWRCPLKSICSELYLSGIRGNLFNVWRSTNKAERQGKAITIMCFLLLLSQGSTLRFPQKDSKNRDVQTKRLNSVTWHVVLNQRWTFGPPGDVLVQSFHTGLLPRLLMKRFNGLHSCYRQGHDDSALFCFFLNSISLNGTLA